MNIQSFTSPSVAKIFIFILLSVGAVALGLLAPESSLGMQAALMIIFSAGILFSAFFAQSAFVVLGFIVLLLLLGHQIVNSTIDMITIGMIIIGTTISFLSLYSTKKNNIDLQFFQTSAGAIAKGIPFFIAAILLQSTNSISVEDVVSQKILHSPLIEEVTGKLIDQATTSQNLESLEGVIEQSLMNALEPKIKALCQNDNACIQSTKTQVLTAVQNKLQTEKTNMTAEDKNSLNIYTSEKIKQQILEFVAPEKIKALLAPYDIPLIKELSGPEAQSFLFSILLFFILLPFSYLFAVIIATGVSVLFFVLVSLGVIRFKTIDAKQEVLW